MTIKEDTFLGFQKGDTKSFEDIFCQYYKTLVSYAMYYRLNQPEAEDIVLEIFHYLWNTRKDIKSAAALNTLLFSTTRHRALNSGRDRRKREEILNRSFIHTIEETVRDERELLIEEEITRLLDHAISQLPGQSQQVILGILSGKSIHEIAAEMQISTHTAKTHKLRAIQILRSMLKGNTFLWFFFFSKERAFFQKQLS